MRVLHVINSLSGSGGAEQGLVREITRLGQGFDQLVAFLYEDDTLAPVLDGAGIDHESLGLSSYRSGWNWPLGAMRLARLIKRFQPDVVHSALTSANLVAQLATRRSRIAVLSTFTLSGDPELMKRYQPGAHTKKAALLRRMTATAARGDNVWFRALTEDALVTNSIALGVSRRRCVVIPRGVAVSDHSLPGATRKELGLPTELPIILNVGRQAAQKGHDHLVRAFGRVRRVRPVHLVILGRKGDGTGILQRTVHDEGLESDVTVVDYTSSPQDYYRQADLFAFTSLMEGLGTAVLEAMAARLPVVAFDIPPVREVTDQGRLAVLVPVKDEERLADSMLAVLNRSGADRGMEELALSWVREHFSIESVAAQLRYRLKELARGQG